MKHTIGTVAALLLMASVAHATQASPSIRDFDRNVTRLPADYNGQPIAKMFAAIATAPKGEFETSAEYEARVARTSGGHFAFKLPHPKVTYDADADAFTVEVGLDEMYVETEERPGYEISNRLLGSDSYVGSNAFGVKGKVVRTVRQSYGLVQRGDPWQVQTLRFPMPRAEAKAVRDNLGVLLYCEVIKRSPLMQFDLPSGRAQANTATGFHRISPTLNSLADQFTLYFTIEVQPLSFMVYERSTGRILLRKEIVATSAAQER